MAFPKELIAAVKDRADIVEVIGERVHLQSAGADFVGLCPFHGEKTPSFRVSPSYRTYHCFGCGAGGSVVDFVMASEGLSFPEALRQLADRYGVPLPDAGPGEARDRSLDVLKAAEAYYRELLHDRPQGESARRYLAQRGFEPEDWQAFGLGWALDDWRGFTGFGHSQGFSDDDLLASGLVRKRETGRMFDMLRKRVTIPIRDERGRTIAFGGRVIDPADDPKYLNTPETRHYRKSRVLFGLAQGLPTLRQSRRALLVEGYLDVMRLHQHGFPEAVATCGTALTEEHLKLLGRYAQRALLVFDGDEAGIKAALRSAPLFLNSALEARVVLLPGEQDPDDFLREQPREAFAALLEEATPLLEFLVFQLAQRNGRSVQGREQTLEALAPVLGQVRKPAARDLTVRYVADLVGVTPESVLQLLPETGGAKKVAIQQEYRISEIARLQRRVPRAFFNAMILVHRWRDNISLDRFTDTPSRKLLHRMLSISKAELREMDMATFEMRFPDLGVEVREVKMSVPNFLDAYTEIEREIEYTLTEIEDKFRVQFLEQVLKQSVEHDRHVEWVSRYIALSRRFKILKASFRATFAPRKELLLNSSVESRFQTLEERMGELLDLSRTLDELRYDVALQMSRHPQTAYILQGIDLDDLREKLNGYSVAIDENYEPTDETSYS